MLRHWPKVDCQRGNSFTTTIHVLVSAIMKLTRVTKFGEDDRLYRGTGGRMALPLRFSQADEHGCKGFTEWGFMSTTSNKAVAIQYSGVNEGQAVPIVFMIKVQSIDRGARISFFSQYPGEEEVLFMPMSFVAPDGQGQLEVTVHGILVMVPVRVNINLSASTIEELIERKKRGHLASFRFLISDLRRKLCRIAEEEGAEERLSHDSVLRVHGGAAHTVEGLVQWIAGRVEEVLASHEGTAAELFTDDAAYKGLVTEMLDSGTMAVSMLCLYLEDPSRQFYWMMRLQPLDAHRALAAFRARSMLALNGVARRAAALRLSQLKGLVVERIDEASRSGETPLVRSVADGTVGPSAIALMIEAGADIADGRALGAAAEHGHAEAVVALISAKAPVDSFGDRRPDTVWPVASCEYPLCDAQDRGYALQ